MNQSLSYMQTFTAKSTAAIKTGKVVHRKIFVSSHRAESKSPA